MPFEPVVSSADLDKIIADLKSGKTTWDQVSQEIKTQIEYAKNPETGTYYTPADFGTTGGLPSNQDLIDAINNAGAAGGTDPVLVDAMKIYYQLYGVTPPAGMVEGLIQQYGDIFAIKDALVAQATADNAPGLATFLQSSQYTSVSPIVSAAESYYTQLYGKQAPTGMIQGLVDGGMDLYAIQNQLLESAGKAGAPGYDNIRYANLLAGGNNLYFKLWGEDAPPTAVKGLVDQGMNLFQMEQTWRSDPTFKGTKTYKDEEAQYAGVVANLLGTR